MDRHQMIQVKNSDIIFTLCKLFIWDRHRNMKNIKINCHHFSACPNENIWSFKGKHIRFHATYCLQHGAFDSLTAIVCNVKSSNMYLRLWSLGSFNLTHWLIQIFAFFWVEMVVAQWLENYLWNMNILYAYSLFT